MGEHKRREPRDDDYGYILGLAITEELLEARIEFDICRLFSKGRSGNHDKREDVLSLSTCLHSSNVCPFLLTLSNISRKASLHEREWGAGNARRRGRRHACLPEFDATSEDIQITLSPLFLPISEKIRHVYPFARINRIRLQQITTRSSQSFESYVVIVPSLSNSRGQRVWYAAWSGTMNTYQSVKTTNFLFSWTGGYGRVLSGAVSACVMTWKFLVDHDEINGL